MYARNNASPRPITIGAVVQISDGAVQATGVSVKVRKDAGSWATGAGTLAVEEGIWSYTPTQGETDCEALQIVIFKASCIPNSMEVVTTSSSSFGHAGTDQSKIANASSTVNLSGTSIKTATDVETDTQDIQNRLPSGLVDGRMRSISEVVGDKTGYKLASDGLSLVTSWAVGITGDITGNLSGSVGSISGVTFPTNFGLLGINGSGHVSRVVLVDTTTTNTDMRGTDGAALATHWTSTRAGYLDGVLLAANFSNRTVQVTGGGSGHIAADVHSLQPAVINNTHFAAGAVDDNALAASAVTEIGAGVWVSAGYAAAIRAAVGLAAADIDAQLDAIAAAVDPGAVWTDPAAATAIRAAMGLATNNLDSQLAAALVLQKLAASGATGSVQVTDNGNGTATLVFKDTNGSTTLATVTYNYTSGARTRVS